jgi:RHS repeat-associated protein
MRYQESRCVYIAAFLLEGLGNTVVMFEDKGDDKMVATDEVIQRYYYYPFGAETENTPWTKLNTPEIRYQYNGKEKINELGLGWNDYGARNYDALLGRWMGVDALAEKYHFESPYTYVHNNPTAYTDPNGKDAIITIKGNVITVSTTIYIYGKDATNSAANNMQQSIMSSWAKQSNGKDWTYVDPVNKSVYTINMDVSVQLYEGKEKSTPTIILDSWNPFSRNNYIEVDNTEAREFVAGGDEGRWTTNSGRNSVPSHEWGHLVGLGDRYKDAIVEGVLTSVPNAGWKGNIMASFNGKVEQRNIDGIVGNAVKDYNTQKSEKKFETSIDSNNPQN